MTVTSRTDQKLLVALALPSLFIYSVAHLGLWPAQMTPDSANQWLVGVGVREQRDVISSFHAALIWLVTRVWLSPEAVVITHAAVLSFVTALTLRELLAWSVPISVVVALAILFPLWPPNIFLITTIWTDVPYGIALLFCVFLILRSLRGMIDPLWIAAFLTTLMFLGLIRHNGLISAALIGWGVAIGLFAARRNVAVVIALFALLAPISVKTLIYPQIGVTAPRSFMTAIVPMHLIGFYITNGQALSSIDQALLDSVVDREAVRARYTCEVDRLFFTKATSHNAIQERLGEIFGLAFRLIVRDPTTYLRYVGCTTELLWKPATFRSPIPIIGLPPLAMEVTGPAGEPIGFSFQPLSENVHAIVKAEFDWTSDFGRRWLFWRPAWPLYLTTLVAAIVALRHRRWRLLLFALPSVATTLSFAPFMHVPAYRYQWGVVLIALLIWPLLFHMSPKVPDQASGSAVGRSG